MAKISASLRVGSSSTAVDSDSAKKLAATSLSFTNTSSAELLRLTSSSGISFTKNQYTTVKIAVEEGGPVIITKISIESTAGTFTLWNSSSGQSISNSYHFKGNSQRTQSGSITAVKIYGYVSSSSSGDSSSSGSGSSSEAPSFIETVTFSPEDTYIGNSAITVAYNITATNAEITYVAIYNINGNTLNQETVSGSSVNGALVFYPDYGGNYYRFCYGYRASNGTTGIKLFESLAYYIKIGELGTMAAPGVTTSLGNNLVLPGETYTLSWSAPVLNGNTINSYQILLDGAYYGSTSSTSFSITNSLQEKGIANWSIKAQASNGKTSTSSATPIYNLTIGESQDFINITADDTTLTSGKTILSWAELNYSVADTLSGRFSVAYNLKLKISANKDWSNSTETIIATGLTATEYTIEEIGDYNLAGKFVCFVIESDLLYDGAIIKTIITEDADGLIKYAGNKPNQLKYILFNNTNEREEDFDCTYNGSEYSFSKKEFKYITKDSTLTIGFNDLVSGYILPGVKLVWKKNGVEKAKVIAAAAKDSAELQISFGDEDFFSNEFWNNNGTLTLTITSAAYLQDIDSPVLEEKQGYFYKGAKFQTNKKPVMGTVEKVSPANKTIPVNFATGNLEPIVDSANGIYEDLKFTGLSASHPQEIDIYGYKIYAAINGEWAEDWKTSALITEQLFSASEGGEYVDNIFVPAWRKNMGGYYSPITNNVTSVIFEVLNSFKNNHLANLLGEDVSTFNDIVNISYRITAVDTYGQESDNYYNYSFYYDFRAPAIFNSSPKIFYSGTLNSVTVNPYGEDIAAVPVFNGDEILVEFYPAFNTRHYANNSNYYVTDGTNKYLKYSTDNSIIDPNNYNVYKFVKKANGGLDSYLVDTIQPFLINSPISKTFEEINDEQVLKYKYQLNLTLNDNNLDEIEYFQIVPSYIEENQATRISRICYYDNNSNGFNVCYGSGNATFWNSRISNPKVQVTGIERLAVTKDEFGFELPKIKLFITDWGLTNQFVDSEKLDKVSLSKFNQFTNLRYSITYYRENDDGVDKTELPGLGWNRIYLQNSEQVADYDTLAAEYADYYDNFDAMKAAMDANYTNEYKDVVGTTKLPIPTTGTTLYINLPFPIKGGEESASNFLANLTIEGTVNRIKVDDTANETGYEEETLQLLNYVIYISQNKKTFIIQQGKLGINQPDLREIEESLYIIDKKYTSTINSNYPNILGLEASRSYNKINGLTGAFIGFYDDSSMNEGERILMGSIGLGMTLDDNGNATEYAPYVIYNSDTSGTMATLKLIPEGGDYISVDGNIISHKTPTAADSTSFLKINYDAFGHINNSEAVQMNDIRKAGRIAYGDVEPGLEEFAPFGDGNAEGDIYFWVQSE